MKACTDYSMDDYIVKPIDFVVLSGVLKKYLPKEKVKG